MKTLDKAIKACDATPESVANLYAGYFNGKVTSEKLQKLSRTDLISLEYNLKQAKKILKEKKPLHLYNAANNTIERILKENGII